LENEVPPLWWRHDIGRPTKRISLKEEERRELERLARQKRRTRSVAFRAEIILKCGEGRTDSELARRLRNSNCTVGLWRERYLTRGVDGLFDEPRSGAPRRVGDDRIEEVVTKTLETTPQGATHWSTRLMAKKLRLSQSTVSRIWRAFRLKPHRSESFVLSKDPQLVQKVRDIVGLYLSPPVNALVLCVDEKSQIQALSRFQPILPLQPGQLERRTPDYFRHGTTTLFAALDVATGKVTGRCFAEQRTQEFRKFLDPIERSVPADLDIHLVLDNYATHKTDLIRNWLAKRPRYQRKNFSLYRRVLAQKPQDTEKIYSLHESHIYCVAKGKEHKKYEFGTKASLTITKTHGVIVAARSPMRRTSMTRTACPKCFTRRKLLWSAALLAPSWIALTGAANGLMAPRCWCPEELPEANREPRVQRCENVFVAAQPSSR